MTDHIMKYEQYESFLRRSLFTDYVLLFFVLLAIIGMVVFALWWQHCERKDALEQQDAASSPESKIDKKIYVVSAILILAITIGAVSSIVDSIIKTSHDIKNKAYVFVDENFVVSETEWWGRWNDTTYTIEFEKNGVKTKIHPNLKFWDLPAGEYQDTIFVYSLESEIILEVKTGDGSGDTRGRFSGTQGGHKGTGHKGTGTQGDGSPVLTKRRRDSSSPCRT